MTTRRDARNADVFTFFSSQNWTIAGPFTLTDEQPKFVGPFGESGRSGFVIIGEAIGAIMVGETNLRLGNELSPETTPALAVKTTKRETRAAQAKADMAALPSLEETYSEISEDGETITLVDDAEVSELLSEFDAIAAEYGVSV